MTDKGACSYAVNTYSYTLDFSAEDCFARLAEQGFSQFELMMYPGHAWPPEMDAGQRKALTGFIGQSGLRLTTLNMPNVDLNIAGAAPEMRAHTLSLLKGVVELAGDLGVPGVIIGPGKYNPLFPAPREQLMGWFHQGLDTLLPLAARAGTSIWVENMPFAFLPRAEDVMEALDGYGVEEVGVVYDIANGEFIGEDLGQGLRTMQPRLRLIHLSDTGREVYRHDPVGQGTVPFEEVAGHILAMGYQGALVLEIISREPDSDLPDSVSRLARQGFDALVLD